MRQFFSSTVLSWTLLTAAVAGVGIALAIPAMAQTAPTRVLTVTGQGSESVPTSKTQVTLGVEVQDRTAEAVQQAVAQRSSAVVTLLRDRQVDQLQTTGIRLNPQYNYENGQARLVGYIGSNTVSFELPTEAVGTLLDDAVSAGATEIQGIRFIATDEAIATAREAALRAATVNARTQADVVLSQLDLGAEEIIGIQIDGASGTIPVPVPQQARLAEASADVSTPVVGGEQTVQATVTLQIRY